MFKLLDRITAAATECGARSLASAVAGVHGIQLSNPLGAGCYLQIFSL